jgi:cytochrome c peroxidase
MRSGTRSGIADVVIGVVGLIVVASTGCEKSKPPGPREQTAAPASSPAARPYDPSQLAVFSVLPAKLETPANPATDEMVALGHRLYFDVRLSKHKDVSCASCHDPAKGGADGRARSVGTGGQETATNAPTVLNAAGQPSLGWWAEPAVIEEWVVSHAASPSVMALPDAKGKIDGEAIGMALGAYLRKLVTPARWDSFLAGDEAALTDAEKSGLGAFMDAGCTACHAGKYVGASMSHKLGIARPWPGPAGETPGRMAITKQEFDKGIIKVPTLRNVTRTSPYLHDGSVASLEEITKLMARHQSGREITDAQARSIVTFLGALDGEVPKELTSAPAAAK